MNAAHHKGGGGGGVEHQKGFPRPTNLIFCLTIKIHAVLFKLIFPTILYYISASLQIKSMYGPHCEVCRFSHKSTHNSYLAIWLYFIQGLIRPPDYNRSIIDSFLLCEIV